LTCAFLFSPSVILAAETGTGTVAETLESGGYVYMKLEDGQWIAANTFAVNKGDKVKYGGAMEMNDFHSKSLDRTFESILFVSEAGLVSDDSAAKTPAKLPGNANKVAAVQAPAAGEIKPLAEGKTIADIFAESDQLKEQEVSLNAKVIKINRNIMGRNWITLQDGTGTEPKNKLVATSQEVVSPGDIMIVKGTVKTDVDLGRGYHYDVMLEEATFSPGLE
jgi:hypothetical protein